MTGIGEGENCEALAEQRLRRSGFHVKLDKGFEEGTYCIYVEYDTAAERLGFVAARKKAARAFVDCRHCANYLRFPVARTRRIFSTSL